MDSRRLLFMQLYVITIVAILHVIGTMLYLYWVFWWYDIVVHFLASIWVALAATWIAWHLELRRPALWAVLAVLFVSMGWEFFEYVIGATDGATSTILWRDSLTDVGMNLIGGGVGIMFTRRGQ